MKEEIVKAEKIVRYLIEIRLIRVFNIEDDMKQYFNDINKYKWRQDRIAEEGRNEVLKEFLTVKQWLKEADIHRSGHQFANPLSEIYHIYAHYTDTSPFPGKLKNKSIVEKCFTYYLYHVPDLLFIERFKCPKTDEITTENCQSVEYQVDDIKGIRYRYNQRGKWMQWRVAIIYRSNKQ
uniref:Uncharacterized protein n=1 Tax=Panagrolaimus sp. ES5 TaxID=591445 RepID=A0AC34FZN1_9BILA